MHVISILNVTRLLGVKCENTILHIQSIYVCIYICFYYFCIYVYIIGLANLQMLNTQSRLLYFDSFACCSSFLEEKCHGPRYSVKPAESR